MNSVFAEIEEKETTAKAAGLEALKKICRDIAAGKTIAPEKVSAAMKSAGKGTAECEAMVRLFQQRVEYHKLLATVPGMNSRLDEIETACAAADAARDSAIIKHDETTGPLVSERFTINSTLTSAHNAMEWLQRNCPDDSLNATNSQKHQELQQLHERRRALGGTRAKMQTTAGYMRERIPAQGMRMTAWESQQVADAKAMDESIARIEQELAVVEAGIDQAAKDIRTITEKMVSV